MRRKLPLWARRALAYERRCAEINDETARIEIKAMSAMVFKLAGHETSREELREMNEQLTALKARAKRVAAWRL